MTRIGGVGGGAAMPRRLARPAGGFALPGAGAPASAAPAAAAGGIAALLALQEQQVPVAPPEQRAARRARAALDELRGLQLDLLRDRSDPARLARLAALAESEAVLADPALHEVVSLVALRVRVELARRGVAGARRAAPASDG